jgi:hypothetical protein
MATSSAASTLLPAFLGCVAAALFTACDKRLSDQNIDQANKLQQSAQQRKSRWPGVSEGMTEKEVESILGEPALRRPGKTVEVNQPVQMATVTYVYEQNGQAIELHFLDGKLQGKVPKFGETSESVAPLKMSKSANGGISAGASGSQKEKPVMSREFRGALADKIKEEEAEIKAQATKGEEKPPAKEEEKKP